MYKKKYLLIIKMPPRKRTGKKKLDEVEGEGIKEVFQATKRVVNKLIYGDKSLPQDVNNFLKSNGSAIIESGFVNRKPVNNMIKTALNVVSLGQFQENLEMMPYDKLFHLSLDLKLSNGKLVKLEKNERINLEEIREFGTTSDDMDVSLPKISLASFIENGHKLMKDRFFSYSGSSNNCQDFIIGLLRANNCLTSNLQNFIKQNTEKLFENIPWVKNIMDGITDLGADVSIIEQGGAIPNHVQNWTQFCSHYYNAVAKPKGISYKDMLKSDDLKNAYKNLRIKSYI